MPRNHLISPIALLPPAALVLHFACRVLVAAFGGISRREGPTVRFTGGPPGISRRASWVVPETVVGGTKQMCSYVVYQILTFVNPNPTRLSQFVRGFEAHRDGEPQVERFNISRKILFRLFGIFRFHSF